MPLAKRVEMSLDPAGGSACATKTGSWRASMVG